MRLKVSQASTSKAKNSQESERGGRGLREALVILNAALAIYFALALLSYDFNDPAWSHSTTQSGTNNMGGVVGAWFSDIALFIFGFFAYLFPVFISTLAWAIWNQGHIAQEAESTSYPATIRFIGLVITLSCGPALAFLHLSAEGVHVPAGTGGVVGQLFGESLVGVLNGTGASLILIALLLGGISLLTGLSWFRFTQWLVDSIVSLIKRAKLEMLERKAARLALKERKTVLTQELKKAAARRAPKIAKASPPPLLVSPRVEKEKQMTLFTSQDESRLPTLSLLDQPEPHKRKMSNAALEAMARKLELKLKDFNIDAEVVAVYPGPVITRFELQPAPGVKGSQIVNLAKDLARSLSVMSVRVVDVIPGKSVIGLEIPNEDREMVRLVEILQSDECGAAKSPLTMALGKDIGGQPVVTDLAKMPHLLVAGTTGSGKSVALNAMILSLLYNATPKEVRMIMIDPKMLELSVYDGIPHLLAPVVTDMKEASSALRWCVAEMESRYQLMAAIGVRNVTGFNRKVQEGIDRKQPLMDPLHPKDSEMPVAELDKLPFIVVIVDELADMMMVVGKKVEELIARLAQKARAAGIHLILATQRPSVDVLTGLIKANIPTRIAFQVSSKVDSRTIIDQMGAEQLLGHGDMLYMPSGTSVPIRIHGAFVDDHEVHKVVDELKRYGEPDYDDSILSDIESDSATIPGLEQIDDAEKDPLYDVAVSFVAQTRKASISSIQRRLKVGYNRAARMVEAMEEAGVVSSIQANGQREVLVPEMIDHL